jgi:O-antigen/teichoic acid export membrane protein
LHFSLVWLSNGARKLAASVADLRTSRDAAGAARRAAAVALVIRLGNAGLAYVAQVEMARLMGQFEYGLFAYTWVWFLVFSAVSTLGFGDSPLRFIPMFRERGELAEMRGFLRFAALITIGAAVATALLVVLLLPYADNFIGHAYFLPMVLMGVALPFACIQSYLEGVGLAFGWTVPALLPIYILRHGLLLVFMLASVAIGFEATAVSGFVCLILALALALIYQAAHILWRLRQVVPKGPRAYAPKRWLSGSAPFAVLYGAANLSSFADVLVLSFFVSPAEIAIYFAATRIIQVVNLVPYAATVGTAHHFAASYSRGDHDELQRLCNHVTVATFAIAVAAVGLLLGIGDWLLAMFGEGFEAGYTPLLILAVGIVARVVAGPAEDILNMTGNGGVSASTYLAIVAVNIVLAVALVLEFGIAGAAVASAFALTARAFWLSAAVHGRLGINTTVFFALRHSWPGRPGLRAAEMQTPAE